MGFFEELETGLFRNHIVVDAVIWNPTAFLNLLAPPVFCCRCKGFMNIGMQYAAWVIKAFLCSFSLQSGTDSYSHM